MTSIRCDDFRDRMPALIKGGGSLPPEESAHLDGCPDCMAEWRLLSAAATLGLDAAQGIDPERVAGRVMARLDRLPSERARTARHWWAVGVIAAAAAVALLVWRGRGPTQPEASTPIVEVLPELDRLETAELTTILEAFAGPFGDVPTLEAPVLDELNADELERVLDTWEG